MNKMLKWLVVLVLASPSVAMASYVNKCLLSGRILESTWEMNADEAHIKVLGATKHGRSDSGCKQYINQTMTITLGAEKMAKMKEGRRVRIVMMTADSRQNPYPQTLFSLYE